MLPRRVFAAGTRGLSLLRSTVGPQARWSSTQAPRHRQQRAGSKATLLLAASIPAVGLFCSSLVDADGFIDDPDGPRFDFDYPTLSPERGPDQEEEEFVDTVLTTVEEEEDDEDDEHEDGVKVTVKTTTEVKQKPKESTPSTPKKKSAPNAKKKQVIAKLKKAAAKKPPAPVDPEKVLFVKNRVVFLNSTVDIKMARSIVARLLYLDSENNQPIQLIINSPGGSVSSGLAIYDTMKAISSPVHTYVIGRASSMAAILAAAGEPGHRHATRHAQIMIHEISFAHRHSKITDLRIRMENSETVNEVLVGCLAEDTHKEKDKLRKLMQRDHYMTAQEALGFNIIDSIITSFGAQKVKSPDQDGKTQASSETKNRAQPQ